MPAVYQVPFIPGNGTEVFPNGEVMLEVTYIAEFPRDTAGWCAFCHGDSCAETSRPDSNIWRYMNTPMYPGAPLPETCPCCNGRPS